MYLHIYPILFLWKILINTPYNSPIQSIQLMPFSVFTELCNHHHYVISEHFHHPKKKCCILHAPFPQPLETTNLLPVSVDCLFWIFHISGIIQYVAFCVWLLSLSMFSRFIHVVAFISVSFLLVAE